MKRSFALLAALYAAFCVYSLQVILWGEQGYFAYQRLDAYSQKLEENLQSLEKIHTNLGREFGNLQHNSDTVALYARQLGYYEEGERGVKIEHMDLSNSYYLVGEMQPPFKQKRVNPAVFRVIAALFGISVYIIMKNRKHMYR